MNLEENKTRPAVVSIVEAILFASDRPVTFEELRGVIPEADEESILAALEDLEAEYLQSPVRGVLLQVVAGGYQLTTRPEVGVHVERFLVGKRRARLSRAALETLATIAYRQPITRGEIEELRGVDSGHVVGRLLERDLITVRGRSEALGRPLIYGTTTEFLRYFGVAALSDLPALEEFEALASADPLDDPEIREALENEGLWSQDEDGADYEGAKPAADSLQELGLPRESDAENGHAPVNGNGHHGESGLAPANGNGHHGENGHAPTNGNGHHGESGHAPTNGNGHRVESEDGPLPDHEDRGENGHTSGHEGGDERSQIDRPAGGAFVPETAVSAELEPPSFGDDEDEFSAESEDTDEWGETERAEARAEAGAEGDAEASR